MPTHPSRPGAALGRRLSGRHWLSGGTDGGHLALLGLLPRGRGFVRDLFARRAGRTLQRDYELLCWWRLSDRISRRREVAVCLAERQGCQDDAEADEEDDNMQASLCPEGLLTVLRHPAADAASRTLVWRQMRLYPAGPGALISRCLVSS